MSAVVYEWPDGSVLKLQFLIEKQQRTPVLWFGNGWPPIVLGCGHPAGSMEAVLYAEAPARPDEFDAALAKLDPDGAKKLLGFALDAGVDRFTPSWTGLVTTHTKPPTVLPYPRWVSDEEWATRYEVARRRLVPGGVPSTTETLSRYWGPLVGGIPQNFFVRYYRDKEEWYAKWDSGRSDSGTMSAHSPDRGRGTVEGSLEEVVDWCLAYELILPASRREAWEAENVLRGTFVLPDEEEVRVFRLLGETLPFFWGESRFKTWLADKGVVP